MTDDRAASPPSPSPPAQARFNRLDAIVLALLGVAALALYFWRLGEPNAYVFDEVYHAFTVARMVAGEGQAYLWTTHAPPGFAYEWVHPPFAKLLMQLGVHAFGDRPLGWRCMSALFGAGGVMLTFAFGRALFGCAVAIGTALLLACDGLWFVQSRICMNDVFLAVLVLGGWFCAWLYMQPITKLPMQPAPRLPIQPGGEAAAASWWQRRRWLLGCGVLLGLGLGTKWSGGFALVGAGLVLGLRALALPSWRARAVELGWLALCLVLLPLGLYVAAYAQLFARGYGLGTFVELQRQIWHYHSHLRATHAWGSRFWTWPLLLKPVWYWAGPAPGGARRLFALGTPLLWWAFLPAVAAAVWAWWRRRDRALGLVALAFLAQWLLWGLSPRVSFLYHMLPCVPFGCLAVARLVARLPRVAPFYLAAVAGCFVFFLPHLMGLPLDARGAQARYWLASWDPIAAYGSAARGQARAAQMRTRPQAASAAMATPRSASPAMAPAAQAAR